MFAMISRWHGRWSSRTAPSQRAMYFPEPNATRDPTDASAAKEKRLDDAAMYAEETTTIAEIVKLVKVERGEVCSCSL